MARTREPKRAAAVAQKRAGRQKARSPQAKKPRSVSAHRRKKADVEVADRCTVVFDHFREGVLVTDIRTKRVVYANPVICRMLGYTGRELTGLGVTDVHPKYEWPFLLSGYEAMARGEITFAAEVPCLSKGGRVVHADISSSRFALGRRLYLVAVFTDVERIKGARDVLTNSEKNLRLILDQSFDGINISEYEMKTGKRRLILCNDKFCQMAGRSREELIGADNVNEHLVVHCDDAQYAGYMRCIKSQKPFRGQASWLRPDGRENYFDWAAAPVKIGTRYYIVGIDRDITEQKRAQEQSRRAEVKYQTLVEQIPAVTYTAALDAASTTLYVSPQVADILGFTREQYNLDHDLWVKNLHPQDRDRVLACLAQSHLSGKPFRCEYRMLSAAGDVRWIRDEAAVVKDERGNGLFLQGVMFDITEQKKVEQRLRDTEESVRIARDQLEERVMERTSQLEAANRKLRSEIAARERTQQELLEYQNKLRSLASELSLAEERTRRQIATDVHDHIGQNLAMVRMKLQSLAESVREAGQSRAAGEIAAMVAEAIESTRGLTFEISPPVLYELGFEAAVEWLLRKVRRQEGLRTDFQTDGLDKPLDENVRVFLFQAVRELLANVEKHARAKSLKVRIARLDGDIEVRVADDGVGFNQEKITSVYPNPRGFGLFNIRERLSCIGGRLKIDSAPGKGTAIQIIAPLAAESRDAGGKANGHKDSTGR